jgi:3-deoxy-7-phosphoheptulonate synthase
LVKKWGCTMIIMESGATQEQIANVVQQVTESGLKADISLAESRTIIDLVGDEKRVSFARLATLPGVKEARHIETPYKLISREYTKFFSNPLENKVVRIGNVVLGGDKPVFIAGPCAVESESQVMNIAEGVKRAGAQILRGGIFKPRSSVHSFQGLGASDSQKAEEALKWLNKAGKQFDLPVVTEVRGENQVDLIAEYVDILQIGARNMYDQDLLTAVARKNKPVLFKRHFGASVEEFLSFAEYIAAENNKDIILCERGIIPVGKGKNYTRYMLDLGSVPAIKKETYLPIIVDPSHAMGRSDLIFNMSCAAIAAGAHGLMIEVHHNPEKALVDGSQAIMPQELKKIIRACNNIYGMITGNEVYGVMAATSNQN